MRVRNNWKQPEKVMIRRVAVDVCHSTLGGGGGKLRFLGGSMHSLMFLFYFC